MAISDSRETIFFDNKVLSKTIKLINFKIIYFFLVILYFGS